MKAFLVMVGSELLSGMMVDTNSSYIAEELNRYGIEISGKMVVGDKLEEIKDSILIARARGDFVIVSGGLGPTIDDLTRDAVAEALGLPLILDIQQLDKIKERYKNIIKGEMPERNIRQAYFPEGAYIIGNEKGSAASFYIGEVVCFPGVPYELQDCLPRFLDFFVKEKNYYKEMYIKDLIVWGLPESEIEKRILDIIENHKGVFIEFLVKNYGILIRFVTEKDKTKDVEELSEKIYGRIGEYIFGEDNDRIETLLFRELDKRGLTISAAESCTGGLISSILAGVAGISKVFYESIVTYSNESKIDRLGVNQNTIEKYGAVSIETVEEMLKGLKTDTGVAVSGIAGPGGGTQEKPVGTVIIGTKVKDVIKAEKYIFTGDRDRIRVRSALTALNNLRKELLLLK